MDGTVRCGIKCRRRITLLKGVDNKDIVFLKSLLNYTEVRTKDKKVISGYNLQSLTKHLTEIDFVIPKRGIAINRIHVSYIIENKIYTKSGDSFDISRRKIKQCLSQIHT